MMSIDLAPKRFWNLFVLSFTSISLFIGCGKSNSDSPEPTSPGPLTTVLTGKINGTVWTFSWGKARPSFSDPQKILIDLYSSVKPTGDICSGFVGGGQQSILLSAPKVAGNYPLSNTQTVTFYEPVGNVNSIAFDDGAVVLNSVSATEIKGQLKAKASDLNYADGAFTVTNCP